MSLKAVVEFVVHVEGFKNIELFHQGLYHIRFTIYHDKNDKRIYAYPYNVKEGKKIDEQKKKTNYVYSIIQSHILDIHSAYCTKTFLIRFCDEAVELNEMCRFRTEFDAYPDYQNQEFFLEAELMFCDLSYVHQIHEKKNIDDQGADFKCVSSFKAKLRQTHTGIHEYIPILFDDQHFCLTSINFHSILMDFRLRDIGSDITSIDKELKASSKDIKKTKLDIENPSLRSFTAYLGSTTSQFKVEELDIYYSFFVKGLQKSYEKLENYYNIVSKIAVHGQINDIQQLLKRLDQNGSLKDLTQKGDLDKSNKANEQSLRFSQIVNSKDPDSIAKAMLTEVNRASADLHNLLHKLLDFLLCNLKNVIQYHKEEHHKKVRERWNESIFQHIYKIDDFAMSYEPNIGENHRTIASARRNNVYYQNLDCISQIEDLTMFPKPEFHPILFEEISMKSQPSPDTGDRLFEKLETSYSMRDYSGTHLIVMVHGFQGNSYDLRIVKNNIAYLYPNTLFLCSAANEENTECEIEVMGQKLADEVKTFIKECCPGSFLGRLSFIGHSLGGLIIRAATEYLEEYSKKFHLYISLSSPHLGYMYNSSKIIDAGLWILKKWKKSTSLIQLSMTDSEIVEDTYLYKLSLKPGLSHFKHIIFVSSFQDLYAPFDSARIQVDKQLMDDSKGKIFSQMAKNIISKVGADKIYRLDINFELPEKTIDTMIGRAAHIQFLESPIFTRMIAYRYPDFFS